MYTYMKDKEFKEEVRHIKIVQEFKDKVIEYETIPTVLSGEVELGELIQNLKFEGKELVNMETLVNRESTIKRKSDETIDDFNLGNIPGLKDFRVYNCIVNLSRTVKIYLNGETKEEQSRMIVIQSDQNEEGSYG